MALITEVYAARGMQKAGINRKNSPPTPPTPPRSLTEPSPSLPLRCALPVPGYSDISIT